MMVRQVAERSEVRLPARGGVRSAPNSLKNGNLKSPFLREKKMK